MSERTFLVVDDSPTMRQLLKFTLKRLGTARVLEAGNGEDALAHLSSETVQLILTDVNMPVMDGLTLIDRVRADPKHRTTPIIVITTEGDNADRERAMSKGATAYVVKPIQAPAVLSAVKRVLGEGT